MTRDSFVRFRLVGFEARVSQDVFSTYWFVKRFNQIGRQEKLWQGFRGFVASEYLIVES
ncbi:hypothetical protein CY34DRAFT_801279 [Suillus luteus UH-Slu-Lm8-n1]|uniref:Uncharacterized protein n=1 Tax=Suillus luteus UH-Slu-Lm8-n1 TaxID=930992 RepID=A0A0D0BHW7_9AGAM|nr:hypothetical protein CY34DRAFT_801279 [Suillus luteus UH-Slu-Lm8-n1]